MDFAATVVTPPYVAKPLATRPVPGHDVVPRPGRGPCLGPRLRATLSVRRRPAGGVGAPRAPEPGRDAGAVPPRVHRGWSHRPRHRRRPRPLPPGHGPRRPGSVAPRGHPPGAGRRARRPDAGDGDEPGTDPPRARRSHRGARSRTTPGHHHAVPRVQRPGGAAATVCGASTPRPTSPWSTTSSRGRPCSSPTAITGTPPTCRLQHQHPGTGWDSGLAMLVDQGDTGLFLGAIHRTLRGVGLDDLLAAARAAGATTRSLQAGTALIALAPGTLTATDGDAWSAIDVPDRGLLPVEWLHRDLVPTLPSPQVAYHHSVEEALALAGPTAVGVLLPAPDFGDVVTRHQPGSPPPREGHVLPAQAEPGRAHALAARRTSRPELTSTSTRDAAAPPARKKRLRMAPSTSTTSPGLPPHGRAPDSRHPRGALERIDALPGLVALRSTHHHPERAQHVPAGKHHFLGGRGHPTHQADDVDVPLAAGRRAGHCLCRHAHHLQHRGWGRPPTSGTGQPTPVHTQRHDRSLWTAPGARHARTGVGRQRWVNGKEGPPGGGPSPNVCPAASYSPTASRLQYHRR